MFDIGWSELLVIAVVAIVVVGPKDLPKLMRSFGHYAGKLRRAASDFQRQFEEAMRESEVEEVRKAIESVRTETPSLDLKAPIDKPMMLPKPEAAPPAEAAVKAKPARKRGPAKPKIAEPKTASAKRGKTRAERGP
ncbi:MAG: Sec-independent protein translocase protein TatB [Methyloceanibacter sp.]